jgi:hypothetical protein
MLCRGKKERSVWVFAKFMDENAKAARRIAEASGSDRRAKFFDEEGSQRLVPAVIRV